MGAIVTKSRRSEAVAPAVEEDRAGLVEAPRNEPIATLSNGHVLMDGQVYPINAASSAEAVVLRWAPTNERAATTIPIFVPAG